MHPVINHVQCLVAFQNLNLEEMCRFRIKIQHTHVTLVHQLNTSFHTVQKAAGSINKAASSAHYCVDEIVSQFNNQVVQVMAGILNSRGLTPQLVSDVTCNSINLANKVRFLAHQSTMDEIADQQYCEYHIHHVSILPLLGHFKDESLAFAFNSQNELASASGNMIVWFPDSAQLTHPTHACGK
ncbi:hypothetical protein DSO57_1017358 [Entomophthora muscae]|uniref:Uncharacterized protein n=1 Tax=Entomophthora muscae TaxID=34485 RepID=A0ACC2T4R3_9FUNG|nr:hypothetical protein DSO57_1017358 [Entomophthora muscae]